ncbi:MAG: ubiquinol-cytochrome c reductase iron-sulfur subunit [Thiotrichaceae bacterium]|jgi:ubiquinol-cytochrome c reductase iron-sulfur subunit|nr:MAG: ubiquinol-cytochrome c reductase iron-sulfur subunit [Thiotrichaceae bacterium]
MSEGDNQSRRNFLTKTMTLVGGAGAGAVVFPLVSSMAPSEKAKAAGAPVKVDISNLNEGEKIDVIWRKKPIWIIKRSKEMIDSIDTIAGKYKDPNSSNKEQQPEFANNKYRSLKPEILVLEGVCTHLGCNPAYKPDSSDKSLGSDWKGGFFCACHGSKFDFAGKVFNGAPAGANLKVPPYKFVDENTVVIGEMPNNLNESELS